MFACIYCPDDKSLVVIGEKSKKLELLGGFQEQADVKLTWGKTVYGGTIVKIGGEEEGLSKFANIANKTVLKKSHTKQHKEILELLYSLSLKSPEENDNADKRGRRQQDQSLPEAPEVSISAISSSQTPQFKSKLLTQFSNQGGSDNRDHSSHSKGGYEGGGEEAENGGAKGVDKDGNKGAGKSGQGGDNGVGKGGQGASGVVEGVGKVSKDGAGKSAQGSGEVFAGANKVGDNGVGKGVEEACVGGNVGEDSEQRKAEYRGRSKQRLPFNPVDQGTSLTSTWSVCTGNRRPPTPPSAVLQFYRALRDPEVQNYISEFLQFHEDQEEMWTDENYTDTAQSQLQHQQTYTSNITAPHEFTAHQFNPNLPAYPFMQFSVDQSVNQDQTQFPPMQFTPQTQSHVNSQMQFTPQNQFSTQSQQFTPQSQQLTPQSQSLAQLQLHSNQDQTQYTHQSQQLTPQSQSLEPMQCSSSMTSNPAQESPPNQHSHDYSQTPHITTPFRRSPRKHASTPSEVSNGMVRLLAKSDVKVDAKQLRKATKAALDSSAQRAGYKLASKVVKLLFTPSELANSCGQGIRTKKGDVRPPLDTHLLDVMKEYITAWCRANNKGTPRDSDINDAVTEQVSYARKQIRNT